MAISVEEWSGPRALSERDLERVVEISNACWDEWIPGEPPLSAAAFADDEGFSHPPEVLERRLARDGGGEVVGFGRIEWRDGEPGTCGFRMFVAPERRGHGVGAALGGELVAAARAAGRSAVTIQTPEGSIGDKVCEGAGLRPDMVVEQNRARIEEASDELLDGWIAAGESAQGYSLVTYDDRCPDDELARAFVEARHVMNDAPRFEGEAEWRFTLAELRAAEEATARFHLGWWSLGVRHDQSGAIVGLSELYLPRERPWIVFQGDTAVAPEHRGHGLGAWMKAVNHRRLRAERPDVRVVQTWNAAANEPMLRINRALGFRPVLRHRSWYLPLD